MQGEDRNRSTEVIHRPFVERLVEPTRGKWVEEEKFTKIFRFNPAAMSIISVPDGSFVEVNPEFCLMTGYTHDEVIGRSATELGLAWPQSGADALINGEAGDALSPPDASAFDLPMTAWRGGLSEWQANIRHKSGEIRIVLVSCENLELGGQDCLLAAFHDITERCRMEEELRISNLHLREWVVELERRTADINLLGQMADMLQTCLTTDEAYQVVAHSSRLIFPEASGALYLREACSQQMEAVATWERMGSAENGNPIAEPAFDPEHCWAMRMGRTHAIGFGEPALRCQHLPASADDSRLCVPLMTKGKALGIYHLAFEKLEPREAGPRRGVREIALAVAEHIALALGNLQLRDTLRQQSTRDPLTGLFNRRHMEDSLARELRRAERAGRPLGMILFDLDHFKRFNDSFGHDAGDYLLKELAVRLTAHSRKEDVACRYGGEEFLLILPEASLQTTQHRAEQLRAEIKRTPWEWRGRYLGPVTLSCGVAAYPRHGQSAEELLHSADTALYRAKREGRDRVCVSAESQTPQTQTRRAAS